VKPDCGEENWLLMKRLAWGNFTFSPSLRLTPGEGILLGPAHSTVPSGEAWLSRLSQRRQHGTVRGPGTPEMDAQGSAGAWRALRGLPAELASSHG